MKSVSVFLLLASMAPAAQEPRTVTVVAGEKYLHPPGEQTWILGENYRALWGEPIEVEVLDLENTASGLRPVMRVGGEQTLGLALAGGDGRSYTFRAVDKDLVHVLPDFLQVEALEDVAQDQLSATVPGVEVVAEPFSRALGVLAPAARLVVMPDSPALGEHRDSFAGVLGTFLEFPQPGFAGSTEIQDHDEFWELRQNDPWNRADTRSYLTARLLDLYLGDWDRHSGQWRWARIPGSRFLQPVVEDRDQVFCSFEGMAMMAARATGAQLVTFEPEYVRLDYGTQNGWDLDRFLLTDLDREEWMEVARDVQAKLTDDVIDEGLHRFPPEYYAIVGERLTELLRTRRDHLLEHAERYYEYMSGKVDVQGSNRNEIALVRYSDGAVDVEVSVAGEDEPYYARRFVEDETEEIRIYLHGGDDRLVVRGEDDVDIKIHVIGGDGVDEVEASDDTNVDFWDSSGRGTISGDVAVRTRAFTDPDLKMPNEDVPWVPSRDFGRYTKPIGLFGYHPDAGVLIGGGIDTTDYGFRKYPWSNRHILKGGFSVGVNRLMVDYTGDYRRTAGDWHFGLDSRFSGLDQLRYYGLGNDTTNDRGDGAYEISLYELTVFPVLAFSRGARGRFVVGPIMNYVDSSGTEPGTVLDEESPTGYGEYGQIGVRAQARYDSRYDKGAFDAGYQVRLDTAFYPEAWDVETPYGYFDVEVGVHLPLSRRLFLSLFTGGRALFGDEFPFFEAAYIGGHQTTAGYNWNRFAGNASLYSSADLKVVLLQFRKMVPGDLGLVFDVDTGRVWLDGESSSKWHPSYGVGAFYAPFHRKAVIEAGIGKSVEKTFFMFRAQVRFLDF